MTLKELANELVAANREGRIDALLADHYHPDVVSVEAIGGEAMAREAVGVDAIRKKHAWWESTFEVHSATSSEPLLHGDDRFAVIFEMDTTNKESGERAQMREVAVYHVDDGKIVREEFFYPMG